MRKWIALLAVVLGCGGPSWDGRFVGPVTTTGSCSDGSGVQPSTVNGDWALEEKSSGLEVVTNGTCGTILADTNGDVATMRGKSCPGFSNGGFNYQPSLTGGRLTLNGDTIGVTSEIRLAVTGASNGTCTTTITGTLTRQR